MAFFGDFHTNYEKKIVHFLILMKSELNFLREQSQFFIFSVLEGLVSYKPVNPPIFSKKDPPLTIPPPPPPPLPLPLLGTGEYMH